MLASPRVSAHAVSAAIEAAWLRREGETSTRTASQEASAASGTKIASATIVPA